MQEPHRVSAISRIHGLIDRSFAQDKGLPKILQEVGPAGRTAATAGSAGGRGHRVPRRHGHRRAAAFDDARVWSRNGYREATVKTTAGPVTLARPKLAEHDGEIRLPAARVPYCCPWPLWVVKPIRRSGSRICLRDTAVRHARAGVVRHRQEQRRRPRLQGLVLLRIG
jgi:hypothetical protein